MAESVSQSRKENVRDLLKLKEDLGADTIDIHVTGKDVRVTVTARHGWDDIEQTAMFSVETLTAFIGDPWLVVREGLREFATANNNAHFSEVSDSERRIK